MQTAVLESQPVQVEQLRMPLVDRPRKPRVRTDSLPEFTRYRDDGCNISDSCFTCPLPRCRYEEPGGLRALLNESRDRQILFLRSKGVGVDDIAGKFGISRRTVFRVIGGARVASRGNNNRRNQPDRTPIPIRSEVQPRKEAHCA